MPLGIIDRIKQRFRRPVPLLTRQQALQAIPIRNPALQWQENDDGVAVIVLPRRKDTTGKILAWAFSVPESRPVVLDEVGTFVWKLCDGRHSMAEIVSLLSKEYKLNKREVELSLNEFFKMLSKRGMLMVAVPNEVLEQLDAKTRKALGIKEQPPAATNENPTTQGGGGESADQSG